MVEVGHEWLCSNRRGGCGRRVVRLELTWWGWDTSGWAQIDMVEGRRRVIRPESTWWRCDISSCAQIDTVRVGDKQSSLSAHGGGET